LLLITLETNRRHIQTEITQICHVNHGYENTSSIYCQHNAYISRVHPELSAALTGALGPDFTQLLYVNFLQMPILEKKNLKSNSHTIINANYTSYIQILLLQTQQNGNNRQKHKAAASWPYVFPYIPKKQACIAATLGSRLFNNALATAAVI
jgi:hypothetical protein